MDLENCYSTLLKRLKSNISILKAFVREPEATTDFGVHVGYSLLQLWVKAIIVMTRNSTPIRVLPQVSTACRLSPLRLNHQHWLHLPLGPNPMDWDESAPRRPSGRCLQVAVTEDLWLIPVVHQKARALSCLCLSAQTTHWDRSAVLTYCSRQILHPWSARQSQRGLISEHWSSCPHRLPKFLAPSSPRRRRGRRPYHQTSHSRINTRRSESWLPRSMWRTASRRWMWDVERELRDHWILAPVLPAGQRMRLDRLDAGNTCRRCCPVLQLRTQLLCVTSELLVAFLQHRISNVQSQKKSRAIRKLLHNILIRTVFQNTCNWSNAFIAGWAFKSALSSTCCALLIHWFNSFCSYN